MANGLTEPSFDTEFEVLDIAQATELCQAMEARGDFKFKGIFALFESILDWSNRMGSNGILPSMDQLQRDVNLPSDKIREYLNELIGRGSTKARMVFPIPAVDYLAGPSANLLRMVVYCRPGKADGNSARRFVQTYIDKNANAVARWIDSRPATRGGEFEEQLKKRIQEGRLPDTQAAAEIARFFYSDLDTTADRKKITYTLFAKPTIKKLIGSRHLILLPEQESGKVPYRAILYNRKNELEERFSLLARHGELPGISSSIAEGDTPGVLKALSAIDQSTYASLPAGQKQVYHEMTLLIPLIDKMRVEEKEKKKKAELQTVLSDIQKQGRIIDIDRVRNITDEVKSSVLGTSSILNTEYPSNGRIYSYVLYKDAIPAAIKTARDLFDRQGDDAEIEILSAMGIERYLDQDSLRAFRDLEQRVLFNRLPWFIRLWRYLFGNSRLKPQEVEKAKLETTRRQSEEKLKIRTVEARQLQRKLAGERVKEKEAEKPKTPESRAVETKGQAELEFETEEKSLIEKEKAEEILKLIINELDAAWDAKLLPTREYLLQKLPDFEEDFLVMFLKKYARKEIFSFRIRNEKPEYVWPVLISRRYIKKNGKALFAKAVAEADEQRKANMPNQEKFDIATSIEDFFNRIMAKGS